MAVDSHYLLNNIFVVNEVCLLPNAIPQLNDELIDLCYTLRTKPTIFLWLNQYIQQGNTTVTLIFIFNLLNQLRDFNFDPPYQRHHFSWSFLGYYFYAFYNSNEQLQLFAFIFIQFFILNTVNIKYLWVLLSTFWDDCIFVLAYHIIQYLWDLLYLLEC